MSQRTTIATKEDLRTYGVPAHVMPGGRQHPALDYLRYFTHLGKHALEFITDVHIKNREKQVYAPWCFVPSNLTNGYIREMMPDQHRGNQVEADFLARIYTALGAWRLTKGIYDFDPDLYDALINSQAIRPVRLKTPATTLTRAPAA